MQCIDQCQTRELAVKVLAVQPCSETMHMTRSR